MGAGLAGAFHLVGMARDGRKALHPRGAVAAGLLRIAGVEPPTGVRLLDSPGEHPCLVRLSRAAGWPHPVPDVLGIAVRVSPDYAPPADILFATTGLGVLGRHTLLPRWAHGTSAFTTLLPYAGPDGPLELALVPRFDGCWDLAVASPAGEWRRCGALSIGPPGPEDAELRFDPVGRVPEGLRQYEVVRRLRAPSYRHGG